MFKRSIVAIIAVTLTRLTSVSQDLGHFVFAEQRPVGQLSAEQRRAIQLVISSHDNPGDFFTRGPLTVKSDFKLGEPVCVGIVITNTALQPVRVCGFSNPYYQNRPQLTRDGKIVSYSEDIRELIRQSDAGELCWFISRLPDIVDLKPNVPLRVPGIELQEWYGPLNPGHYTLLLKRTFACCADGQWSATNTISFDVTP